MHADAYAWLAQQAAALGPRQAVLELGSHDINGTPRPLFPAPRYLGIDRVAGPGVDVVADAATYTPPWVPDTIVCAEMLEHAEDGRAVCAQAYQALAPGGAFLVTCATAPRAPHSGHDGLGVRAGEYYGNVEPAALLAWLGAWPTVYLEVHTDRGDLYALARKGTP